MYGAALLLSGLCLLATSISALPTAILATSPPFQITNLKIHELEGANTTIKFTVYDPDPLTNATHNCTGKWATGSGGYPQGSYKPCGNSTFAWNMYSYTNIQNFMLGVEHEFTDPAIGDPPYDQIITFGKGNVTSADVECVALDGWASYEQEKDGTIKAPIYATTAKRR